MSRPDFENIDLWMFEYAEGNLTPEQVEKLRLFVLLNPELDIELDAWKSAKIESTPITYPKTQQLLRKPSISGHRTAIVATAAALLLLFLIPISFENKESSGSLSANTANDSSQSLRDPNQNSESTKQLERIEELELENSLLREELAAYTQNSVSGNISNPIGSMGALSGLESAQVITEVEAGNNIGFNDQSNTLAEMTATDLLYQSNIENTEIGILEPHKLEPISAILGEEQNDGSRKSDSKAISSSSGMKRSFGSKMRSMARSIQRMMDNPIALKNSRDPMYALPGLLPQDVNFSSAGTLLTTRVQTLSRVQWLDSEQEQFMNKVNIDGYSYAIRGGIGVQMAHSSFHNGGIQNGSLALTYSPKFSVNKFISVEPSLRFKMGAKVLDFDRINHLNSVELEAGIQHDFYPNGQQPLGRQLWYKDLGTGVLVNTKWFYAGFNVDNLFRHRDNIYDANLEERRRMGTDLTLSIGTDWENSRENMRLSPYVVLRSHETLNKIYTGANFQWNWFVIGASCSSAGEPSANIGLKFKNVGLFYFGDYSQSLATGNKMISHQISLRINGNTGRYGKRLQNL
jgi:hypothetical protein